MDDPSNWRGDQDIVDLASWRAAGLGEFEDDDARSESKPPGLKEVDSSSSDFSVRLKRAEDIALVEELA